MFGSTSFTILLAGLASINVAYAQVAAWHMDLLKTLTNERLDPIVSPNGVASHMHQVVGGSAFGAAYNFADLRNSKCTTASITADKSNYWMPKLYWMNADNSFTPIPAGQRFYYFLGRNSGAEPVAPFPEGLRMLLGNPNAKSANGHVSFTCHVSSDLVTGDIYSDNFNFDRDCPYGVRVESNFPVCWNGNDLYKSDGSHVVYPASSVSDRQGPCPWTHPIRIPQIMLEYTFLTSNWAPGKALKGNLAWANGDTTGFGVHADFTNGWDTAVLGAALNSTQCAGSLTSQAIQGCEVLAKYYNTDMPYNCKPDKGQMNEPGQSNVDLVPIDALPGCNLKWGATGSKPTCATTPASPAVGGWTGTDGSLVATGSNNKARVLPTTPGWKEIGCIKDTALMMTGVTSYYFDTSLSATTCQNACLKNNANYAIAGMADGRWNCVCGTGIDPSASVYPGMCTSPCPGNSSEICGASSVHSVFYAPLGTTAKDVDVKDPSYLGCYYPTGTTSLTATSNYKFDDPAMTNDLCLQTCANKNMTWAATANGKSCYCGSTYNVGSGYYVNQGSCSMTCAGNSTQACGWAQGISVYNVTASKYEHQALQHPDGWTGCFSDPGMKGLTSFSWTGSMTPDKCTYGCAELGYKLAGLVMGNRCKCGNTWAGGSEYPVTSCQYACDGNSSLTCGGNYNTELYDTTIALSKVNADIARRPAGWSGCYANSVQTVFKDYYAYDGSLTVQRCETTCKTYGYSWAGVQNQYYCRCTSTDPTGGAAVRWPSNIFCQYPCPGNNTQTCGAANQYVEAYNMTAAFAPTPDNSKKNYVGCYSGVSGLTGPSWSQSDMSVSVCAAGCKELGYALAGASGNNCYCGNTWNSGGLLTDLSCTQACSGNSTQVCGGYYITSLWNSTVGADLPSRGAGYAGCYTDSGSARALTGFSYTSSAMTNKICQATCGGKGFTLAGTSGGNYCYCGNAISNGQTRVTSALCTNPCPGDSTQICGSTNWKLSVFNVTAASSSTSTSASASASVSASANVSVSISGSSTAAPSASSSASAGGQTSKGCYSDVGTLSSQIYQLGYMTVDNCISFCSHLKYTYAGLTNGDTCRCGNTAPTTVAGRVLCNKPCISDSTQTCGGPSQIDVWTTTQSTSFKDLYSADQADSTGYMGCWNDWTPRLLAGSSFSSGSMTPATCLSNCVAQGYKFAGLENGNQCFCSNAIDNTNGYKRIGEDYCSYGCSGDGTKRCGGSWKINVWTSPKSASTPSASVSATVSGSKSSSVSGSSTASASASPSPSAATIEGYVGCYGTGTFVSKATDSYTGSSVMAPSFCRRYCRNLGYAAAALSGGGNCYCGATSTLGTKMPDASCTYTCTGDANSKCGDAYMASVYDTTGLGARTAVGFPTNYVGCFRDWTPRLLGNYSVQTNAMTSDNCRRICSAQGFSVYGTENGNQCFCGENTPANSQATDNECYATCNGDSTERCGASWRLSLYSAKFAAAGSYNPKAAAAPAVVVSSSSSVVPSSSSTSKAASSSVAATSSVAPVASSSTSKASSAVSTAAPTSSAAGATSKAASSISSSIGGGLLAEPSESSSAAVTSSELTDASSSATPSPSATDSPSSSSTDPSPSASAADPPSSSADPSPSPSASDSASATDSASASASDSAEPSSSSSTATSTTSSAAAAATTSYLGCYSQPATPVLNQAVITCDVLTPAMCKVWCNANSFAYAGLTNGTTCGCASDITKLTAQPAASCNKACFTDKTVTCGSSTGLYSVWKSSGLLSRRSAHSRRRGGGRMMMHAGKRIADQPLRFESEAEILEYLEKRK